MRRLEELLGERVTQIRSPIALRTLAERLSSFGLNLNHSSLSRIEHGQRSVSVRELLVLAAALGVSPGALVTPADEDEPVAITDDLVRTGGDVRRWFEGRRPLSKGTRGDERLTEWPMDRPRRDDAVLAERRRWEEWRPPSEQRVRALEGARRLLGAVDRFTEIAAVPPRAGERAGHRLEMAGRLEEIIHAAIFILDGIDAKDAKARGRLLHDAAQEWARVLEAWAARQDEG